MVLGCISTKICHICRTYTTKKELVVKYEKIFYVKQFWCAPKGCTSRDIFLLIRFSSAKCFIVNVMLSFSRVIEVLFKNDVQLIPKLRTPAVSRFQKLFNVGVALDALKSSTGSTLFSKCIFINIQGGSEHWKNPVF